jgi:hypothetical protein
MLSFPVVKHLNVLKGHVSDLFPCLESIAKDTLIFETVEPAFPRRIIPAFSLATHRARHSIFRQQRLKEMARILTSSVRVMGQSCGWSAMKPCHRQCIGHNFRRHTPLQRPSNHLPVKQVKHDGQVQPTFIRPQIGNVRRPDLVRCARLNVPIQHVVCHWQIVFRICRRLIATLMSCPHIILSHQAFLPGFASRKPRFRSYLNMRGLP